MRLGTKPGFYSEPSIQLCLSLALVFLISGLAEKYFGLAMIIGSYSLGLALSGTPLFQQIKTPIHRLNGVVVPIFFTVVGMQVNLQAIFGGNSIVNAVLFAIALSILGIISKLAGCGLPALLVGFNRSESWKIGVGMIPRGEVALIIGGIALASGVISQQIFGVTIIMTLVTTIIAPIMLVRSYR
jgi:Kef-type K+ transport system membrane component KefB